MCVNKDEERERERTFGLENLFIQINNIHIYIPPYPYPPPLLPSRHVFIYCYYIIHTYIHLCNNKNTTTTTTTTTLCACVCVYPMMRNLSAHCCYFPDIDGWPPKPSSRDSGLRYVDRLKLAITEIVLDGSTLVGRRMDEKLYNNHNLVAGPCIVTDSIESVTAAGVEALKIACKYAHVDLCTLLLSPNAMRIGLPAPVNASGTDDKNEPLHALFDHAEIDLQRMFVLADPYGARNDPNPKYIYHRRNNVVDHMSPNTRDRFIIASMLLKNGANMFVTQPKGVVGQLWCTYPTPLDSIYKVYYGPYKHINIERNVYYDAISEVINQLTDMVFSYIVDDLQPLVVAFVSSSMMKRTKNSSSNGSGAAADAAAAAVTLDDDLIELTVDELVTRTVRSQLKSAWVQHCFDPETREAVTKR